ncbi:MAG: aminoacyl-tRNA hydrolase [Acidimicrobiia bacterium]
MRVVVGLRNPGSDYEGTRHNAGSVVVSRVLDRLPVSLAKGPTRLAAMVAQDGVGDAATLYVLPNAYMNESGGAVAATLTYYKVEPEDLLVVHDDIDLPFGRLRVQVAGGSGGHNGIRSIEKSLGTKEFTRLKFGVGRPPSSLDPADFVLRRFTKTELPEVEAMTHDAADVIQRWLEDRSKAQEMAARRTMDD